MNQAVEVMLKRYRCQTRPEYERALKEVLQEIALVGLWRARFFEHAAFYGGTALRIFYGLDRFSEDMDFTLLEPTENFSLEMYNSAVQKELESYGFTVTVEGKPKAWQTAAQSAFIKTNTLGQLLKIGIPKNLIKGFHPETQLKIKVEVDTDPIPAYRTEMRFLKLPMQVDIRTVNLEDIFAGKMHALLFRQWKGRVKGRDWYDWLWLVRHNRTLNLERLSIHLQNSKFFQEKQVLTKEGFENLMYKKIQDLDLESALNDVRPFVADYAQVESWSKEMLFASVKETITDQVPTLPLTE